MRTATFQRTPPLAPLQHRKRCRVGRDSPEIPLVPHGRWLAAASSRVPVTANAEHVPGLSCEITSSRQFLSAGLPTPSCSPNDPSGTSSRAAVKAVKVRLVVLFIGGSSFEVGAQLRVTW
jgi:hypothetical protein